MTDWGSTASKADKAKNEQRKRECAKTTDKANRQLEGQDADRSR